MLSFVLAYLAAINLLTFAVFAVDKRSAAAGARRTPERTLLGLAALGGGVGAVVAQQVLRHKTRKQPFALQLRLIVVGQVCLLVLVAVLAARGALVIP